MTNAISAPKTAYDFSFHALNGQALPLSQFARRPMLIVNTASRCGFTPQYAGLQGLWQAYRERGLVVLGVPSNDFGAQEPGDHAAIAAFCSDTYGVDFPMTEKVHVSGAGAHPLFEWLAREGGFLSRPRWNFFKYLIGRDGDLKGWFSSLTPPQSARVARALTPLL